MREEQEQVTHSKIRGMFHPSGLLHKLSKATLSHLQLESQRGCLRKRQWL